MIEALAKRVASKTKYLDWYRHLACKANAMPVEPDEPPSIDVRVTTSAGDSQSAATSAAGGANPATANTERAPAAGWPKWVVPAVLGAASVLGGGGLGWLVESFGRDAAPPVAPADVPADVRADVPREGSLFQDLEDRGFHLPGNE